MICAASSSILKLTVSNFKQHLKRRHPTVSLPEKKSVDKDKQDNGPTNILPVIIGPSSSTAVHASNKRTETNSSTVTALQGSAAPTPALSKTNQSSLETFLPNAKRMTETQKEYLDKLLLKLFIYMIISLSRSSKMKDL